MPRTTRPHLKFSIHKRREHGKEHTCPHVGYRKICVSAPQPKKHILTHTREKPQSCNICHKTFTQKSHITHHVTTVHAESGRRKKNNVCPQHRKCFVFKSMLVKHMIQHSNYKQHQCAMCNKTFVQKSHL